MKLRSVDYETKADCPFIFGGSFITSGGAFTSDHYNRFLEKGENLEEIYQDEMIIFNFDWDPNAFKENRPQIFWDQTNDVAAGLQQILEMYGD